MFFPNVMVPSLRKSRQLAQQRILLGLGSRSFFSTHASQKVNGSQNVNGFNVPATSSEEPPVTEGNWIQGQVLDLAADLSTVHPGDKLDVPYELTISESMQDFWQSAFHCQDRIHTSTPYCRKMGLQDRVLPFSLALLMTSSMTYADHAKIQVGFGKVSYLWPAFAGDTFTIRNTSDGNHAILHFTCDLFNQRNRLCMRADKRMLFDFTVPNALKTFEQYSKKMESFGTDGSSNMNAANQVNEYLFRDHLLSKANVAANLQSHTLADLRPGQLIFHSLNRSLTFTQSQQLASLARLTHEKHFDRRKYDMTEILIPGELVLGITMSASARDFHEVLHEEILNVNYVNSLNPGNMVGAISYIQSVEEAEGDMEVLTVRTLGIKNIDIRHDLHGVDLPLELFEMSQDRNHVGIKSKQMQEICKMKCQHLYNKIVVQVDRRILRQANRRQAFLL